MPSLVPPCRLVLSDHPAVISVVNGVEFWIVINTVDHDRSGFLPPTAHLWPQRTQQDTFEKVSTSFKSSLLYIFWPISSSPHAPKLAATWPLPSNEGCRPPNVDVDGSLGGLVCWEQVGNTRGDPWYGRPTRYVRRGAIIGFPTFSNFHSVYILTRLDTRCPLTHPAPSRPRHHHLPCMQERSLRRHFPRMQGQARGGHSWLFDAIFTSSASLACQSEPEVVWWGFNTIHVPLHLPHMPDRAGGGHSSYFRVVHTSSTSLACKSKPEVNVHGLHHLR